MKNSLKLMLLSSVMMLWGAPGQAQTCATQPTCAELGYTLTSTSSCIGTVLKCPFDKTKYYCTQKTEVTAAVMPDYSKSITLGTGTNYTLGLGTLSAYSCGWALMSASDESVTSFYINDVRIGGQFSWNASDKNDWWNDGNAIIVPLLSGDKFRINTTGGKNTAILRFYPCKNY